MSKIAAKASATERLLFASTLAIHFHTERPRYVPSKIAANASEAVTLARLSRPTRAQTTRLTTIVSDYSGHITTPRGARRAVQFNGVGYRDTKGSVHLKIA